MTPHSAIFCQLAPPSSDSHLPNRALTSIRAPRVSIPVMLSLSRSAPFITGTSLQCKPASVERNSSPPSPPAQIYGPETESAKKFAPIDRNRRPGLPSVVRFLQAAASRGNAPQTLPAGGLQERFGKPGGQLPQSLCFDGARVNELSLVNNSDRPLLVLAGEIVTGGKQDRVVSKDRIIPPHSQAVALGVFCVEPQRWSSTSVNFGSLHSSMAQPSVRSKAMADQNQQEVWNEVAKSRMAFIDGLPQAEARRLQGSSSYASAVQSRLLQGELNKVVKPIQQSYDTLIQKLRAEHAVGVVAAVNGEIIWADVFASSDLLNRFWPKLIRPYAAESFGTIQPVEVPLQATQQSAQQFLDRLGGSHESIDSEPGVYRNAEISGDGYSVFILTALLPGTGFDLHLAKMKR